MSRNRKLSPNTSGRRLIRLFALALLVTPLFAALLLKSPRVAGQRNPAADQDIERVLNSYDRLSLQPVDVLKRVRQTGRVTLDTSRGSFDLEVEPFDIRADNYRSIAVGADGVMRDLPRTASRSFRGKVAGRADVFVRLVLDNEIFEGIIITPDETYFVEPRRNFSRAALANEFVFYSTSNVKAQSFGECGTTMAERVTTRSQPAKSNTPQAATGISPEPAFAPQAQAEIATDSDFEFTSTFGTGSAAADAANNDILNVMTLVDGIYDVNLGVDIKVVSQRAWTANNDPYTSTAASTALTEFRTNYDGSFPPNSAPARDLAHLFTGKDFDGGTIGIAYLASLCDDPAFSYGISQSKFSGPSTPMSLRSILTAHETGHNFGATHPDEETSEPTNCSPSIMNSSIQNSNQFCQFSRDQITNHVTGTGGSCLTRLAAPGCTYSLSSTSLSFPEAGGNGSVNVNTTAGCAWAVAEGLPWFTASTVAGTGPGTAAFTVAVNGGGPRSGTIDIGGQKLTVTQPAAAGCGTTAISPGQTLSRSLQTSDCRSGQAERPNAYIDLYTFNGIAGQQIRIEMSDASGLMPPQLDTYLYLFAPDGTLVAQNDDIVLGDQTNSRLPVFGFFTLPQTGTYTIESTSFDEEATGAYTLALTSPPLVLIEQGQSLNAVAAALDSVTFVRGPFHVTDLSNFSADQITRVLLFTSDLGLNQSNPLVSDLSVKVAGVDLVVEDVRPSSLAGINGSTVIVALKRVGGGAVPTGNNLQLTVTCRGLPGNASTISISP